MADTITQAVADENLAKLRDLLARPSTGEPVRAPFDPRKPRLRGLVFGEPEAGR